MTLCSISIDFQFLSFLAVIFGWFLVNNLNIRREQRSEWRKFARELASSAEIIEKEALEYHRKADRDRELEEIIIQHIDRLEAKYTLLEKKMRVKAFLAAQLRQAVTLENFFTDTHTSCGISSDVYGKITKATLDIINDLYGAT